MKNYIVVLFWTIIVINVSISVTVRTDKQNL